MSHYLKILLDCIFGENNFRNEIVWHYQTGGASKQQYAKKHDVILFYSKTDVYNFYPNRIKVSRTPKALKRAENQKGARIASDSTTKLAMDVWVDIQALNPMSNERLGYPTQKPIKLLKRIIEASSNKGDVILDPFCGCATTCIAAELLERQWVGIDISRRAYELVSERIDKEIPADMLRGKAIYREDIPSRTDMGKMPPRNEIKRLLYGLQEGVCKGCKTLYEYKIMELDHIVPKAKGGGDNVENLQLLCTSCNKRKSTKTMEQFVAEN